MYKSEENFIDFKGQVMQTSKKEQWSIENTRMTSIWRKVPKIGGKYVMNSAPELNIGGNMYPRGMAEKLEHNFSYISN